MVLEDSVFSVSFSNVLGYSNQYRVIDTKIKQKNKWVKMNVEMYTIKNTKVHTNDVKLGEEVLLPD